ncbi:E3 ubiquitin-protein ligase TRIM39-like [Colossoma macropomum]|uniref:E3 ubiquitin-protein ligase TRIM39-like n=1 Tax=Colossoma macropomum TaxID=42526 RepID=UPI0018645A6D|nr:E3 ubiquitin-protein ligase TRIM39-like [Colossoma macropomum]
MDPSMSVPWEEEFKCCICLDVLTDPVSTPCGHNFCMACIEQCWTSAEVHHCPLCKEKFSTKPELKVNTTFKAVVHHFQMKMGGSKPTVPCDVCSGQKMKAVKSCLDCGTTFCETHLENHKTAPRLIKHKLMDPVENLEDYICQKHERPLELFCRDDQTSVCRFCTEGDHKTHSTVPIEEESGERKMHLRKKQEAVQQMIKHRHKKIEDIRSSVQRNKESSKKTKAHTLEVFRSLMHCIERSQAELLEVMEEKQKAAERQAEEFIKELEQEITELKRRDTELEQLSHTEDHLHLLQVYPSLCSRPLTKNWTDVRINTHLRVETLRRTLSQLQEALNKELKRLSKTTSKPALHRNAPSSSTTTSTTEPADSLFRSTVSATAPSPFSPVPFSNLSEGLGKLQKKYAVNVTLDPKTAYPKLVLSADGKRVWHGYAWQNVPNNPERFDTSACVLGKEGFSSGRFYYEVQVTGKTVWVLGVVRESINRKGMISVSPENGYWTVHLRNETEFLALSSPPLILSLKQTPQKLGVFVDYEEGLVSFYDVEARSDIYSFTGQSFTEKLYPFFFPCNKGESSKPIIISPIIPCC